MPNSAHHTHARALRRWVWVYYLWQVVFIGGCAALGTSLIIFGLSSHTPTSFLPIISNVFGVLVLVMAVFKINELRPRGPRHQLSQDDDIVELSHDDAPELFEFINATSKQLDISPPEHIHVSATVNAAIYYQHVWYGAFQPQPKQLIIGLGLVNWLNRSEFQAVLVHEMAHMAQPETVWSGYVQAIHQRLVRQHINKTPRWRVPGTIKKTFALVYLKRLHDLHTELIKQLELHADGVAATFVGSQALTQAIPKLDRADQCMTHALNTLANMEPLRLWTDDIFYHQKAMDQWVDAVPGTNPTPGLHPTNDARVRHANDQGNHSKSMESEPAWTMFDAPDALRRLVTAKLIGRGDVEHTPPLSPARDVQAHITQQLERTTIDAKYASFYPPRVLPLDDLAALTTQATERTPESIDDQISDLWGALFAHQMTQRQNTQKTLSALDSVRHNGDEMVMFDGKRWTREDLEDLTAHHQRELQANQHWQLRHDHEVFLTHLAAAHHLDAKTWDGLLDLYTYRAHVQRVLLKSEALRKRTTTLERQHEVSARQLLNMYEEMSMLLEEAAQIIAPSLQTDSRTNDLTNDHATLVDQILNAPLIDVKTVQQRVDSPKEVAILFFAQCSEIYLGIQNVERESMVTLVVFHEEIIHNWKTTRGLITHLE